MRIRSSIVRIVAAIMVAVALAGCGSLRLYSDTRDKQGQAAKKAWSEVDLKATIDTERGNLQKLLTAELETQDQLAAGIRDHELRFMVTQTLQVGLVDPIVARFVSLVGKDERAFVDSRAALRDARRMQLRLSASLQPDFDDKGFGKADCGLLDRGPLPPRVKQALDGNDAIAKAETQALLKRLRSVCSDARADSAIVAKVYGSLGGEIAALRDTYVADVAELDAARRDAQPRIDAYRVALADYKAALASNEPDNAKRVRDAAGKLKDAAEGFDGVQDAFSISFLSKQRLDALDAFVKAVTESDGGKVPMGASKTAVAFIVLPDLLDDAVTSLEAARKPLALPLLIRANYEQLRLEAANREIAARESKVRLSREMLDAAYEQAFQLWFAKEELKFKEAKVDVPRHLNSTFLEVRGKATPDELEHVYGAAARYLDSVNRLTARRYKLEYQRVAVSHELSLAYAEVNVRQWSSLIGTVVDQVADSSALGIRPESITNLLNTLGVLWIGSGVNK